MGIRESMEDDHHMTLSRAATFLGFIFPIEILAQSDLPGRWIWSRGFGRTGRCHRRAQASVAGPSRISRGGALSGFAGPDGWSRGKRGRKDDIISVGFHGIEQMALLIRHLISTARLADAKINPIRPMNSPSARFRIRGSRQCSEERVRLGIARKPRARSNRLDRRAQDIHAIHGHAHLGRQHAGHQMEYPSHASSLVLKKHGVKP